MLGLSRTLVRMVGAWLLLVVAFSPLGYAYAYNPFEKACSTVPSTTDADACQKQDPIIGADGVIMTVANFIALVAGVAAVIIIIIGSIQMITSGGDASRAANGRKAVIYALIGLVVVAVARSIVAFVINNIL